MALWSERRSSRLGGLAPKLGFELVCGGLASDIPSMFECVGIVLSNAKPRVVFSILYGIRFSEYPCEITNKGLGLCIPIVRKPFLSYVLDLRAAD